MKADRLTVIFLLLSALFILPKFNLVSAQEYTVRPVIFIANDFKDRYPADRIEQFKQNILQALRSAQDFYASRLDGSRFNYINSVEVIYSDQNTDLQNVDTTRGLFEQLNGEYSAYDRSNNNSITAVWLIGSGSLSPMGGYEKFAFPPEQLKIYGYTIMNEKYLVGLDPGDARMREDSVYAFAHELGHAFGLTEHLYATGHPCTKSTKSKNCLPDAPEPLPTDDEIENSIMGRGWQLRGKNATLNNSVHNAEVFWLCTSPYFAGDPENCPEPTIPTSSTSFDSGEPDPRSPSAGEPKPVSPSTGASRPEIRGKRIVHVKTTCGRGKVLPVKVSIYDDNTKLFVEEISTDTNGLGSFILNDDFSADKKRFTAQGIQGISGIGQEIEGYYGELTDQGDYISSLAGIGTETVLTFWYPDCPSGVQTWDDPEYLPEDELLEILIYTRCENQDGNGASLVSAAILLTEADGKTIIKRFETLNTGFGMGSVVVKIPINASAPSMRFLIAEDLPGDIKGEPVAGRVGNLGTFDIKSQGYKIDKNNISYGPFVSGPYQRRMGASFIYEKCPPERVSLSNDGTVNFYRMSLGGPEELNSTPIKSDIKVASLGIETSRANIASLYADVKNPKVAEVINQIQQKIEKDSQQVNACIQ